MRKLIWVAGVCLLGSMACDRAVKRVDGDIYGSSEIKLNRPFCAKPVAELFDASALEFVKVAQTPAITPGFAVLEGGLCLNNTLIMSHIGSSNGVDAPRSDLVYLSVDNTIETYQKNLGTNGLTINAQGDVLAAMHSGIGLGRVSMLHFASMTGGNVSNGLPLGAIEQKALAVEFDAKPFNSPNDVVVASNGVVYFSDPSWQAPNPAPQLKERAYYKIDGVIRGFGAEVERPNGLMLSRDEDVLYLGGKNGLFKYSLDSKGRVSGPGQSLFELTSVDGMSRDCLGNIYITDTKQLTVINAKDEILAQYPIPGATNVAFCGGFIYVTAMGANPSVYRSATPVPGLPF